MWNFEGHMNCLVQLSFCDVGDHGKPEMESLRGTEIRTKETEYSSDSLEIVFKSCTIKDIKGQLENVS